MKQALVIALLCLSLSGCALNSIFINYPSQLHPVKAQLNSATPSAGIQEISGKIDGADGLLYAQEAGRVAQISGDFATSRQYFEAAEQGYKQFDDQATLSVSDLGATASSVFINDNVIPYRGPGYERIMLHQYQALNYLFSGDSQGALVEVRRANQLQSDEQRRYQKSEKSVQAMANGAVDAEISRLETAAGDVTSSFLNAYSYYTTGLLYELLGEPNDAFIDYRKAAQLAPENRYLQQDLVRLAQQLSMPQAQEFQQRWGKAPQRGKEQGQVVFIVERGFVPEKQSFSVPFRIDGNWQTASLATYSFMPPRAKAANITGLPSPLKAQTIANIDALAVTALKEELPMALVRQAARVYAKAEMASSVRSDSKRRHNETDYGAIAMQIFNVVSEQADRRSWLTLPQQAQIARSYVDAGQYNVGLDSRSTAEITIETGRTTLVWAIDTGNYTRFYSIII